jgi:hypothetical protein
MIRATSVRLALVVGVVSLAAGCSSGNSDQSAKDGHASSSATASASSQATAKASGKASGKASSKASAKESATSQQKTQKSPDAPIKGAASDLGAVKCGEKNGTWSASGVLKNTSKDARKYKVKFAVVTSKTSEVKGEKSKQIQLEPGRAKKIDFPSIYQAKPKDRGLVCAKHITLVG